MGRKMMKLKQFILWFLCLLAVMVFCWIVIWYSVYVPDYAIDNDEVSYKIWGHTYLQQVNVTNLSEYHVCGWPFKTKLQTHTCSEWMYFPIACVFVLFSILEIILIIYGCMCYQTWKKERMLEWGLYEQILSKIDSPLRRRHTDSTTLAIVYEDSEDGFSHHTD